MKYYVKWDCLGAKAEGMEDLLAKQIEHIEKSGRMKDGGPLLGVRGGYFIFDVEKPAEILALLGRVFLDNFNIEIHPVLAFKDVTEIMKTEYRKAA